MVTQHGHSITASMSTVFTALEKKVFMINGHSITASMSTVFTALEKKVFMINFL